MVRMSWTLFRRLAWAIVIGGLSSILAGAVVGACMGGLFSLIGAAPGLIIGAVTSFFAGLIGTAIGDHRGWAIGGSIGACLGLLFVAPQMLGTVSNGPAISLQEPTGWHFLMMAGVVGLVYGSVIGIWYAGRMDKPFVTVSDGDSIEIYGLPLSWRLTALGAVLITIFLAGVDLSDCFR